MGATPNETVRPERVDEGGTQALGADVDSKKQRRSTCGWLSWKATSRLYLKYPSAR